MEDTTQSIDNTLCPKNCPHLYPNEAKQRQLFRCTNKQVNHMCTKYDVRLYHFLAHPNVYKCEECLKENCND